MAERTLIASGTNLLVRGYYAVPVDRRWNALFAVTRGLLKAIAFKVPARAVAIVDTAAPFPGWPPALTEQLPRLAPLLRALGIAVVEAPDELHLVASYAEAALHAGDDVVVAGMDKRYAQLVGDRAWWYDPNKDARYTPEMVMKRFGVGPDKVAEWLALVGNPDDAIPGVAGIGAKGATGLLATYGSVAGALENAGEIKGRAGNALRAAKDQLAGELARTRLDRARPLPVPLADLGFPQPDGTKLNDVLRELGFVEFLATDAGDHVDVELGGDPRTLTPPVAIHALTEDPTPVRGALVGLAFSSGARKAIYVPMAEPPASLDHRLVAWLEDARIEKLGHDAKIVDVALRKRGIRIAGVVGDTAAASHLGQPSNWAPHDLPIVSKHVIGRALPSDETVRGVGQKRKAWGELDVERVASFAGTYAEATAETWKVLGATVDAKLHAEYRALGDVLVRMELTGIAVDAAKLQAAEASFAPLEAELQRQIFELAGHELNLGSTKQLGEVLFAELKLPVVSHTKTGWSTATEALERIEHAHPIVPLVIRWRLLRRLTDSWIHALRANIDDDGRVHACFHPSRSFSGRIVNSNPDLGRVPGRTPEMARIRRAFVARPGWCLMSVDYNQLGLHVLAHLTKDPALVEPLRAHADVHLITAAACLEKSVSEVTPDERQLGKVINFATFAGQGSSALALQLNVSPAEAKELIARFDRTYSRVRAFQDEQSRLAHERGYITTIAGRRWPIGGLESLDPHDKSYAERLARRATHEGSVSDVSRRGLLDADTALRAAGLRATPLVQVLDEVVFEVPEDEISRAAKIAADAMRSAFLLEAPLRVGVEVGPNWADLQPYDA